MEHTVTKAAAASVQGKSEEEVWVGRQLMLMRVVQSAHCGRRPTKGASLYMPSCRQKKKPATCRNESRLNHGKWPDEEAKIVHTRLPGQK